ncbi:MAG: NADH dehydrogenase-like protein [Haliscomenobacter sp.]|jgi:NADH dehydrogenase|nr:NADH dehydrogenase-like protein [Haliscomenobacter sp.]
MKINLPETGKPRVVIVGAGFAGLTLANRLARTKQFQIVVLDKNNYHQFQPLFYQVAMSGLEPSSISFPLRKFFQGRSGVYLRTTEVTSIEPENKRLQTPLGIVNYDYLVLATGAQTNFFGNQEISEKAIPMKSVSEALFLRNRILEDYEQALTVTDYDERQTYLDIVIAGGGPTGVELAGAFAEMKKYILPKDFPELNANEMDIFLVEGGPRLLSGMSETASQNALHYLENLGVQVLLNTLVTGYNGNTVTTKDGREMASRKLIWAAGIKGDFPEGIPQRAIVRGNRLKVDAIHQVDGMEQVYAIGDLAYQTEPAYPNGHPQVAQVAMQQAQNLAYNMERSIKNQPLRDFHYKDLGSMATIGRNKAVVDLPRFKFKGAFAWYVWLFVHLFQLIGVKNRLFVFLNWVMNYFTYDQSLRLIIKPFKQKA